MRRAWLSRSGLTSSGLTRSGFMLASLAFACCASTAADLPSGESLMQRFIEKSGGSEAWARVKNSRMKGMVEVAGRNLTGTVELAEEGRKSRVTMELPGIGRIEQGFDGETAWENNIIQGARILEGDEKSALKRSSGAAQMISWKDDYTSARTTGEDTVDGKACWIVEMTPKEGKPETFCFDKDSGLLTRVRAVVSTPLGDIAADVTMSGYRPVDGLLTPFATTQSAMGQEIVMHFDSVVYNTDLPKDQFALPAEVQALLAGRDGRR